MIKKLCNCLGWLFCQIAFCLYNICPDKENRIMKFVEDVIYYLFYKPGSYFYYLSSTLDK